MLGLYIFRERLETETEGYIAVFRKLVENGVISEEVGDSVERLTRLRNLIIHRYWEVDDTRVYREAREGVLNIVKRFVDEVKSYASGSWRGRGSGFTGLVERRRRGCWARLRSLGRRVGEEGRILGKADTHRFKRVSLVREAKRALEETEVKIEALDVSEKR